MTLRRAEDEGGVCLPSAGKKNAELFQEPSTSCGKPENAFADFEIFQGNSCACDAVERVSQLNDIGSGRMGSNYVAAKSC